MADVQPFDRLHPVLQHHIVNTLGWSELRPLQSEAIEPLLAGSDAVLLAPTAGGKTEAAMFPLLSRMESERWGGLSVLYVCPLKALLNNLQPRLETYAGWLGRAAYTRHGDTTAGARRHQVLERPSILLTTPESLEAMLVSPLLDAPRMFGELRTVVVDEVHAFAKDDRGWHLLAVLERLAALAGRPLQRVGLSATVGNPAELLEWLQGRTLGSRPATVVAPPVETNVVPELALDYVGNVGNAAAVLAQMHLGEKRLVFADSRRTVEDLAVRLREREVETFVSHSSLSLDERRRAETAFSEARNCVIVSTSTLELGIDVGDLDRVIQIGAPNSVSSLLQRLGRTGRRPGTTRNMTFLALDDVEFARSLGLLLLLSEGFVEAVVAPPEPRHVAAQQFLGAALQNGHIDVDLESTWIAELGLATGDELALIKQWLLDTGHLDVDSGLAFVGPTAERRYGPRNFMELLAIFTAAPEVAVLHGRTEIGSVDPMLLTTKTDGPRVIALAGRPWQVTHIDWKRRRAYVEPSDGLGKSKWSGDPQPYSFELSDAIRRVLLGADPSKTELSRRAVDRLANLRETFDPRVSNNATVIAEESSRLRWWTFAGARANAVLTAAIGQTAPDLLDEWTFSNLNLSLRSDATAVAVRAAMREARSRFGEDLAGVVPEISQQALKKLKFSELLPPQLALQTLAARGADWQGAASVAHKRIENAIPTAK
ncbi:DEAD/DEAH box helicase [Kribbella sp. CA-293567]|uniref:DEAD/DEAH box helicase n=1 Tax=Kribbella sp. CA-293567 TaxID=3002436 RepID=UPI0022DD34D8|nr:DEAD/DEAH box helicase [Kribbella sp. CA-293567]WBQ04461.1 DEAD/DEAH box helicase [Kribbella sp. CA-293567]